MSRQGAAGPWQGGRLGLAAVRLVNHSPGPKE